jgi:phage head maturation protease
VESIKRGDVDQSSFAFTVDVEQWDESGNPVVRTIVKVRELYDVSPVTYPAYPTATSGVRSLGDVAKEHKKEPAPAPKAPEYLREKLQMLEV